MIPAANEVKLGTLLLVFGEEMLQRNQVWPEEACPLKLHTFIACAFSWT
jgi:hypothetical protein